MCSHTWLSGYGSCRRLQQMTERILPGALRMCGGMDELGKGIGPSSLRMCGWMDGSGKGT